MEIENMKYIVLLRGINISGKNKIAMSELKDTLIANNYINVVTYLNSGNVILERDTSSKENISEDISKIIKDKFNLDIPNFVMTDKELEDILNNYPTWWGSNNKEIYDNLICIIPPTTYEMVYKTIGEPIKGIERIEKYKNYIFWSFDLKNYRKCNWWIKTASTNIKDQITIRTANTMRKVLELCNK